VRSSLFQSETELLELLQRLRQLEFTVQAIMVSRDETAAACASSTIRCFFVHMSRLVI